MMWISLWLVLEIVAKKLTFHEAIEYGLASSVEVQNAKRSYEQAHLSQKNASKWYYPVFLFKASTGYRLQSPFTPSYGVFDQERKSPFLINTAFTMQSMLFDSGVSILKNHQEQLNVEFTYQTYLKTRDQFILKMLQNFNQYSKVHQQYFFLLEKKKLLEKQFKFVSNQYLEGLKNKSDYIRFKAGVQQLDIQIIQADYQLKKLVLELTQLMSQPEELDFVPFQVYAHWLESLPNTPLNPHNTYEYRLSALLAQMAQKKVEISKREDFFPSLHVTIDSSYNAMNNRNGAFLLADPDPFSLIFLLELKITLWDWGIGRQKVAHAIIEAEKNNSLMFQETVAQNNLIKSCVQDLQQSYQSWCLSLQLLKYEQETNQIVQERYKRNQVSIIDVMDSVKQLFDARQQQVDIFFQALNALAQYKYFEAKIYELVQTLY